MAEISFTIPELTVLISFHRRPISLPADFRPHWLIAVIVLILWKSSRGAKATLQKLHVLSWAIRDSRRRRSLISFIEAEFRPEDILVRYEPGLDRAIRLAVAERLIAITNHNQVQLAPRGSAVAKQIEETKGCMADEVVFLGAIGSRLTEKLVKALVSMEAIS